MTAYQNTEEYTEADTRAKLIDPALYCCGWNESMIRREETAGAIEKIAGKVHRSGQKRADYVLRVPTTKDALPVAVALIEAKRNTDTPAAGMAQAKRYATRINVPFVFSSNGYQFVEYDAFNEIEKPARPMTDFPSAAVLRRRYEAIVQFSLDDEVAKPLGVPYSIGDSGRRYYQDAAIRATLEKIANYQKQGKAPRVLLSLATGAGKTFIAVHLLKRLQDAGAMHRALFLCDRDALRMQALGNFQAVFGNDAEEVRRDANGNRAQNARVHVATYQTLGVADDSSEEDKSFATQYYPPNYFSHIVIDECHRSAWGKWSEILRRNPQAVHIGLSATPRNIRNGQETQEDEKISANNYRYFGEPVYSYGLAQGAEDGYLALCEIHKSQVDLDLIGVPVGDLLKHNPTDFRTGQPLAREELKKTYQSEHFENKLMLRDRVDAMCQDLFNKLAIDGEPRQKTIIFCVRKAHAEMVVAQMNNLYTEWRKKHGAPSVQPFAFVCTAEEGSDELSDFRTEDSHHFVAATVDLLSTGVDITRVRNIVFFRYVRSPIALHQMIGRGARIDEPSGKLSFAVYDYTNATDLLGEEEWKPPSISGGGGGGGKPPIIAQAEGFEVVVSDGESYIAVEDEHGALCRLSAEEYQRKMGQRLLARVTSLDDFRAIWTNPRDRAELIQFLRDGQCLPGALADLLQMTDCDDYDILASCVYGALPRSRQERVDTFSYKNVKWLEKFPKQTATTLLEIVQCFAVNGVEELENPNIFSTPQVVNAGGLDALRQGGNPRELLHEAKKRLLAA